MLWIITGIFTSYLIGSIPTAYIFGRVLKGIDIRQCGSGNVGATNALRVLGKPAGISVLLIDVFKGFVAVFFLGNFFAARVIGISDITLRVLLGFSCICGHNWTVFLRFKGGKGVATTLGVLLGLAAKAAGIKIVFALVIATWLVIFILTRFVSLASILCAVALPIYMFLLKQPYILVYASILLAVFIVLRHKENIKRLLQGKESRLTSFNKK